MIHNLLILICAFIILARETKYKILILRVDEIMLALFLAALESNEDKQRFTRGYKRYKETSGLIEWKECQIFHSIFT